MAAKRRPGRQGMRTARYLGPMRRGLLLVDHGSRAAEANQVLETLASAVASRVTDVAVRTAHLELAEPRVDQALAELVACGVEEIVVVPHFLAPGRHTRRDLPAQVARAAAPFPTLRVSLAEPLGAHPGLVELLLERAGEAEPLDPSADDTA